MPDLRIVITDPTPPSNTSSNTSSGGHSSTPSTPVPISTPIPNQPPHLTPSNPLLNNGTYNPFNRTWIDSSGVIRSSPTQPPGTTVDYTIGLSFNNGNVSGINNSNSINLGGGGGGVSHAPSPTTPIIPVDKTNTSQPSQISVGNTSILPKTNEQITYAYFNAPSGYQSGTYTSTGQFYQDFGAGKKFKPEGNAVEGTLIQTPDGLVIAKKEDANYLVSTKEGVAVSKPQFSDTGVSSLKESQQKNKDNFINSISNVDNQSKVDYSFGKYVPMISENRLSEISKAIESENITASFDNSKLYSGAPSIRDIIGITTNYGKPATIPLTKEEIKDYQRSVDIPIIGPVYGGIMGSRISYYRTKAILAEQNKLMSEYNKNVEDLQKGKISQQVFDEKQTDIILRYQKIQDFSQSLTTIQKGINEKTSGLGRLTVGALIGAQEVTPYLSSVTAIVPITEAAITGIDALKAGKTIDAATNIGSASLGVLLTYGKPIKAAVESVLGEDVLKYAADKGLTASAESLEYSTKINFAKTSAEAGDYININRRAFNLITGTTVPVLFGGVAAYSNYKAGNDLSSSIGYGIGQAAPFTYKVIKEDLTSLKPVDIGIRKPQVPSNLNEVNSIDAQNELINPLDILKQGPNMIISQESKFANTVASAKGGSATAYFKQYQIDLMNVFRKYVPKPYFVDAQGGKVSITRVDDYIGNPITGETYPVYITKDFEIPREKALKQYSDIKLELIEKGIPESDVEAALRLNKPELIMYALSGKGRVIISPDEGERYILKGNQENIPLQKQVKGKGSAYGLVVEKYYNTGGQRRSFRVEEELNKVTSDLISKDGNIVRAQKDIFKPSAFIGTKVVIEPTRGIPKVFNLRYTFSPDEVIRKGITEKGEQTLFYAKKGTEPISMPSLIEDATLFKQTIRGQQTSKITRLVPKQVIINNIKMYTPEQYAKLLVREGELGSFSYKETPQGVAGYHAYYILPKVKYTSIETVPKDIREKVINNANDYYEVRLKTLKSTGINAKGETIFTQIAEKIGIKPKIEPQVSEAVKLLNEKGYETYSSGFYGPGSFRGKAGSQAIDVNYLTKSEREVITKVNGVKIKDVRFGKYTKPIILVEMKGRTLEDTRKIFNEVAESLPIREVIKRRIVIDKALKNNNKEMKGESYSFKDFVIAHELGHFRQSERLLTNSRILPYNIRPSEIGANIYARKVMMEGGIQVVGSDIKFTKFVPETKSFALKTRSEITTFGPAKGITVTNVDEAITRYFILKPGMEKTANPLSPSDVFTEHYLEAGYKLLGERIAPEKNQQFPIGDLSKEQVNSIKNINIDTKRFVLLNKKSGEVIEIKNRKPRAIESIYQASLRRMTQKENEVSNNYWTSNIIPKEKPPRGDMRVFLGMDKGPQIMESPEDVTYSEKFIFNELPTQQPLSKELGLSIPKSDTSLIRILSIGSARAELRSFTSTRMNNNFNVNVRTEPAMNVKAKVSPSVVQNLTPTLTPIVSPIVTPIVTPVVTPIITPTVTPTLTPIVTPIVTPVVTPVVTPTVTPNIFPNYGPKITGVPGGLFIDLFGKAKKKKVNKAYSVLLRRRGKFIPVGSNLPRGRALLAGQEAALRSIARTFKIVESGATEAEDINFAPDVNLFRDYRVKKGKAIPTPNLFIQKRSKALSTKSERIEIGLAKQEKQIRKSMMSF